MNGFGTFGLSLAELAINVLSAVFVVFVGSLALAESERTPSPVCPPPCHYSANELDAARRATKDAEEEADKLRQALIESEELRSKLHSGILPACSPKPLFEARAVQSDYLLIKDQILPLAEVRRIYRRDIEAAAKKQRLLAVSNGRQVDCSANVPG